MKKNYLIGFSVAITIVVISFIVGFLFIKNTFKEKYCTSCDYVYDIASEYIKEDIKKTNPDRNKKNFMTFVSYDTFGVTEKRGYKYAYMWIIDDSYYKENDDLEYAGGSSMFYKVKLEDGKVIDYEIPRDGTEYDKSVKKMSFDNKMYKKIINYSVNMSNEDKIKEYYSNK